MRPVSEAPSDFKGQYESTGAGDQVELLLGVLDCLFGFGAGLAERGYIEHDDLAEIFENVVAQQRARADAQHPGRQYPAKLLAQLFRTQFAGEKIGRNGT